MMIQLVEHRRVTTVTSDQCEYGATTHNDQGEQVPCKKPTKWATTSIQMQESLSKRCSGTHIHQPLMGGRAAAAAYYPLGLITAILRGIRNTADAEDKGDPVDPQLVQPMLTAGYVQDEPSQTIISAITDQDLEREVARQEIEVKYADGSKKRPNLLAFSNRSIRTNTLAKFCRHPKYILQLSMRLSTLQTMSSRPYPLKRRDWMHKEKSLEPAGLIAIRGMLRTLMYAVGWSHKKWPRSRMLAISLQHRPWKPSESYSASGPPTSGEMGSY